jgi:hypothetical protein
MYVQFINIKFRQMMKKVGGIVYYSRSDPDCSKTKKKDTPTPALAPPATWR